MKIVDEVAGWTCVRGLFEGFEGVDEGRRKATARVRPPNALQRMVFILERRKFAGDPKSSDWCDDDLQALAADRSTLNSIFQIPVSRCKNEETNWKTPLKRIAASR